MTTQTISIRTTCSDPKVIAALNDALTAALNDAMAQGAKVEVKLGDAPDVIVTDAKDVPPSRSADKVTCEECGINEHKPQYPRCYHCTAARKSSYRSRRRRAA